MGEGFSSRVLDGSWLVPVSESCCGNVPEGSRNLGGDWQVPRFGEVAKNGRRKFPRRFGGARVPGGNGKERRFQIKLREGFGKFWVGVQTQELRNETCIQHAAFAVGDIT